MNGAKIPGYQSITICIIKDIANVIPEIFFERRGVGGVGVGGGRRGGFLETTIIKFTSRTLLYLYLCANWKMLYNLLLLT